MNEIKCPHCGKVFQVDESGYAAIVKQVRDEEFRNELNEREIAIRNEKESAIKLVKTESDKILQENISKKDLQIQELNAKVKASEKEKTLAVKDAIQDKNEEISSLKTQLATKETEKQLAVSEAISSKDKELSEKSQEILKLNSRIESIQNEYKIQENAIKEKYEEQLKGKDEIIDYYKDFKAKQSTKMIGESLEQHCEIEFNKLRATGFKNAYFEKDNDA